LLVYRSARSPLIDSICGAVKGRALEAVFGQNLRGEQEREANFLIVTARNSLKRLNSEK
jgi:hypothetical protein